MYDDKLAFPADRLEWPLDQGDESRLIEDILAELLIQYQPLCGSIRLTRACDFAGCNLLNQ